MDTPFSVHWIINNPNCHDCRIKCDTLYVLWNYIHWLHNTCPSNNRGLPQIMLAYLCFGSQWYKKRRRRWLFLDTWYLLWPPIIYKKIEKDLPQFYDKTLIPTEMSIGHSDNTKTPRKSLITQRLPADLGQSVRVTKASQLYYNI